MACLDTTFLVHVESSTLDVIPSWFIHGFYTSVGQNPCIMPSDINNDTVFTLPTSAIPSLPSDSKRVGQPFLLPTFEDVYQLTLPRAHEPLPRIVRFRDEDDYGIQPQFLFPTPALSQIHQEATTLCDEIYHSHQRGDLHNTTYVAMQDAPIDAKNLSRHLAHEDPSSLDVEEFNGASRTRQTSGE